MRTSAECLAKAVGLAMQAEMIDAPIAAEFRAMAEIWRGLSHMAEWQDAISLSLLDEHRIR